MKKLPERYGSGSFYVRDQPFWMAFTIFLAMYL